MKIAPFYPNQKIIAVEDHPWGDFKEGDTFYAGRQKTCSCGCGAWVVHIGINNSPNDFNWICSHTKKFVNQDINYYYASRFRPLQEQTAPLIKLSQIQEKEKEKADPLILIEN